MLKIFVAFMFASFSLGLFITGTVVAVNPKLAGTSADIAFRWGVAGLLAAGSYMLLRGV